MVGQDQVERALLRVRAEYPGTHFDDLLAQERLSQTELKARLREQLLLERLFEAEVFPQLQVSQDEIERYYAEHPQEFEEPEAVHVLQIVVASKDEAVQLRDKAQEEPAELRRDGQQVLHRAGGEERRRPGLIGRGSGFPEVFDVCFTLPLNAISEVTPSPYGFHLFQVVERRPRSAARWRRPRRRSARSSSARSAPRPRPSTSPPSASAPRSPSTRRPSPR